MTLRGHEISSNERYELALPQDLLDELDPEDPWTELFNLVGIRPGPPKVMVFPLLLGRREIVLNPLGIEVILTIYQYSPFRYYCNVYDIPTQRLADLVLNEENMPKEMVDQILPFVKSKRLEFIYEMFRKYLGMDEKKPEKPEKPEGEGSDEEGAPPEEEEEAAGDGKKRELTLELFFDKDDPFIPGQE